MLKGLFLQEPNIHFPINDVSALALATAHRRGDPSEFLNKLAEYTVNPSINKVTVVLINYGDTNCQLSQEIFFNTLNAITKSTILICSACYAKKIIFRLDRDHKLDNFLKIWDNGVDMGETCNWGVALRGSTEPFEMGTQLLFWLFDVLYDAKEDREVYTNIVSYRKIRKLSCVLDYSGSINFLKQSFFGPNQPNIELKQPSVLGVSTTTRSPQEQSKRPQFKDALVDLVDNFLQCSDVPELLKAEFWSWVYQTKYQDTALEKKGGYEASVQIARELKQRGLITIEYNGAGLPDVLVTYDLAPQFLEYLASH
eukprot:Phypoly_transcript_13321.p1 GENE.Phypoly_transcript_13321~~Phypoly_transcript_13321.p1  ORF type:complete len:312 (+),score=35.33 Phypoly_transcript_13321:91-1026(+)